MTASLVDYLRSIPWPDLLVLPQNSAAINLEHPHMRKIGGLRIPECVGKGFPQLTISADVIRDAFEPSSDW